MIWLVKGHWTGHWEQNRLNLAFSFGVILSILNRIFVDLLPSQLHTAVCYTYSTVQISSIILYRAVASENGFKIILFLFKYVVDSVRKLRVVVTG